MVLRLILESNHTVKQAEETLIHSFIKTVNHS